MKAQFKSELKRICTAYYYIVSRVDKRLVCIVFLNLLYAYSFTWQKLCSKTYV